jgi:hypothetical protein
MPVGLPATPTPPQPPQPAPPPPPPPPPPPVVIEPDPTTVNQNEDVEEAASPVPEDKTPRADGVTLPNEIPRLHPPPGGTVNSGQLSIDERA